MKIKFTILLIFNTAMLVAITYLLLYAFEHGANKIAVVALIVAMAFFILLFFLFYLQSFKAHSKSSNLGNEE